MRPNRIIADSFLTMALTFAEASAALFAFGVVLDSDWVCAAAALIGVCSYTELCGWVHFAAKDGHRLAVRLEPLRRALAHEPDDRPR